MRGCTPAPPGNGALRTQQLRREATRAQQRLRGGPARGTRGQQAAEGERRRFRLFFV
jgi:hypothetical protein